MPFFPNSDADWSNLPPELQAYYQQIFSGQPETGDYPAGFDPNAGAMPPQAAGPPGIAGLEGGWGHIPQDEMSFIQELLTPRNVQRSTQFAGGSHYGPDRNKSIPAENFAQAKALLEMMSMRDAQQRSSEMGALGDQMLRGRIEAERTNLSPGSITMNGETVEVPGKMGVQTDVTPAESVLTGVPATVNAAAGGGGKGGGGSSKETEASKEAHWGRYIDLMDKIAALKLSNPEDPQIQVLEELQRNELAAYRALQNPNSEGEKNVWRPGAGAHSADVNGDGYVMPGEAGGGGGGAPVGGGGSTYQPELSAGQKYMQDKMGSFNPITSSEPSDPNLAMERGFWGDVGNQIAGWARGNLDDRQLLKAGKDPETGEFMSEDDPRLAKLHPWEKTHAIANIRQARQRMANANTLGYPPYESQG